MSLINGIKKDVHTYCPNLDIILDMVFITKLLALGIVLNLGQHFHVSVNWQDLRAKVFSGSNSVIYVNWTFSFECCVVKCRSKNIYQTITCLDLHWSTCA